MILQSADVRFEIIWRTTAGDAGASDHVLATFNHHFDARPAGNFDAVTYEADATGVAAQAQAGDQLVLRIEVMNAPQGQAYIPNGDGARTNGRIPSIALPQ